MKRTIKRGLLLALTLCLTLTLAAPAVQAVSLQEQSWLQWLAPGIPKTDSRDTHRVTLLVKASNVDLEFHGTCSLKGEITDEEKLQALRDACSAVDKYSSPEDAADDQRLADALKLKLQFKAEDKDRIVNNWVSMLGLDKVKAIFGGQLPQYGGGSDAAGIGLSVVTEFLEAAAGGTPDPSLTGALTPVPLSVGDFATGLVINGAFITWDEFWRDQSKWNDRVELLNAQARLRTYYEKVGLLVDDLMRKNLKWKIEIQDQVVKKIPYRGAPSISVPGIFAVDVDMTKEGNGGNAPPTGRYVGRFVFKSDLDLSDYDRNFHKYLADYFNQSADEALAKVGAPTNLDVPFTPVSQTVHSPSVNELTLSGENVAIQVSLPEGQSAGVVKLELEPMMLEQTRYRQMHDFISVLQQKSDAATHTLNWAEMTDSGAGVYYNNTFGVLVDRYGHEWEYDNPDRGSLPNQDLRPYMQMVLILEIGVCHSDEIEAQVQQYQQQLFGKNEGQQASPATGGGLIPSDLLPKDWPDNRFTAQVPAPSMEIMTVADEEEQFSAVFSGAKVEDVRAYAESLRSAGFTRDVEVTDQTVIGMVIYNFSAVNAAGYRVELFFSSGTAGLTVTKEE